MASNTFFMLVRTLGRARHVARLLRVQRQPAIERGQLAHVGGVAQLIQAMRETRRIGLQRQHQLHARGLVRAPRARIPARTSGLRIAQIRIAQCQVGLADLARNQAHGHVEIGVLAGGLRLRRRFLHPCPGLGRKLPCEPAREQLARAHAALLADCAEDANT
jgi:hypothetical protein